MNCICISFVLEFYDRVDGDLSMGFGGLQGRGHKKQDSPIERELYLSLEEVFHGCTKKMKISRRVSIKILLFTLNLSSYRNIILHVLGTCKQFLFIQTF